MDLASGLAPRLTPLHTIELVDANGIPRLRIDAPEGRDAAGISINAGDQLKYLIEGTRLTLKLEADGLKYPLVVDPTWATTGSMTQARQLAQLVLLKNGKVLAAGGVAGNTFATCEIFDPQSETWSATGSMSIGRVDFTLTTLNDGRILACGGQRIAFPPPITSCDIYDPNSGTWAPTAQLAVGRYNHCAALLPSGNVLVCGGYAQFGTAYGAVATVSSSEIYDVSTSTWTSGPSMSSVRAQSASTVLADSSVLVSGGVTAPSTMINSCEIYSPQNNTWTTTGAMNALRADHDICLLNDGTPLVIGGDSPTALASCEKFSSGLWQTSGSLNTGRYFFPATVFAGGRVLASGGITGVVKSTNILTSTVEIFDPNTATWSYNTALPVATTSSTQIKLNNEKVLLAGGSTSSNQLGVSTCYIFDPHPFANPQTVSLHSGKTLPITLSASALTPALASTLTYSIVATTSNGNLSGTLPLLSYTAPPHFAGIDTFTFKVNDGILDSALSTVTINVTNMAPILTMSASPTLILEGQSVFFSSAASDPDGDAITYAWDFNDGSTSTLANPTHAYSTAGTYIATLTITDSVGATTSSTVTINVFKDSDRPTARFTSSDLNGYVGQPLGFDASFSTDPKNNIVAYDWDFGDGSPHGSQQIISRIYSDVGTYTVILTITDGDGLTDTTSLTMVVLPAEDSGLFNSNIKYSVNWNRSAANTDSLNLRATVNVGNTTIAANSPLSLGIVGEMFTGTSVTTRSAATGAKSGAQVKWQIKPNKMKGAPGGTYDLQCKITHASLGQAFALAGVTGTKSSIAKIPVRLGIGASSFESSINSQFRFGSHGVKASGGGQGPR